MAYTRLPHNVDPAFSPMRPMCRRYAADRVEGFRGWFVTGAYLGDGAERLICARPEGFREPLGWRTKGEAAHIARAMNEGRI